MYSFKSRVRYSELGSDNKMTLPSIINYFQDCSTFQSEDLGIGMDYVYSNNHAWILSSWQIVVNKYPGLGEYITTSTWPYDFKGIYGYRNFLMKNDQEDILAYANSIWVYINIETGLPTRVTNDIVKAYDTKDKLDMNYSPRKIPVPKDLEVLEPFPVGQSNLDTNMHVNNGQYVLMGQEFLPEGFTVRQMRADYRQAAKLGDIIVPKVAKIDDSYIVVLSDDKGKPYTTLEFKQ